MPFGPYGVCVCIGFFNLLLATLQVWLLSRRPGWPRWLAVFLFLWAIAVTALFVLEVFSTPDIDLYIRRHLYFPAAVEMVWNLVLLPVFLPVMLVATLLIRRLRPVPKPRAPVPAGLSRRRFLYLAGCGAVPALATGLGSHGYLSRQDLRLRSFDIPVAGLPPELEGFSIAHVSDLHSGMFVGPQRLKIMSDLTNDLKADLVVVTGDLINRFMEEFPDALAAIRRIESRYGTFLCEGNHDCLPGAGLVLDACRRNGLRMLWNETATLPVRGRRLLIGGLPWMNPGPDMPARVVTERFPPRAEGDFRILLAHHPHFFDVSDQVDLLLSGHTHGGQIMFGDVGLGNLRFKYNSGRYHRGNMTMIVNNGCGDWFPCRIGAPAEVGLLRLTRAKA